MSTCSRCGNQVEFRYVDGRCIPLHFDGGCESGMSTRPTDYSKAKTSKESVCFATKCPKCSSEVFFIRHNGGSVWIDPPLGYPWFKHPCFFNGDAGTGKKRLIDDFNFGTLAGHKKKYPEYQIGIVKETFVEQFKRFTKVNFQAGRSESTWLEVKSNSAGFLLGKVCVFDSKKKDIWPLDDSEKVFRLFDPDEVIVLPPKKPIKLEPGFVRCRRCGVVINKKNLNKHRRKVHGIQSNYQR